MQQLDRELVLQFQNGDEQAYVEIFKRYHGRVWGICRRMLPTAQDAEEASQETFLKAYQALGRFNGSFYLGAWLGRIATNVCVDHLRSKSKSNLVALPEDQDDLVTERGPEEIVIGEHPRLHRAIQQIQPLHASALALRTLEGLSHQEIAGHLRMSPTQVKALLHRARNSLRKAWDKAEGWAVAPLFALRHLVNDRTGDAGRLASVSPTAAPFIMERVAASAIIVAAALSGLPAITPGSDAPQTRAPHVAAAPFRGHESGDVASQIEGASVDAPAAAAAPAAESAPAALAQGLVADITGEIDKALAYKKKAGDSQQRQDDGGEDPIGPTASEGEKGLKKVRKVVNDVVESVAP